MRNFWQGRSEQSPAVQDSLGRVCVSTAAHISCPYRTVSRIDKRLAPGRQLAPASSSAFFLLLAANSSHLSPSRRLQPTRPCTPSTHREKKIAYAYRNELLWGRASAASALRPQLIRIFFALAVLLQYSTDVCSPRHAPWPLCHATTVPPVAEGPFAARVCSTRCRRTVYLWQVSTCVLTAFLLPRPASQRKALCMLNMPVRHSCSPATWRATANNGRPDVPDLPDSQ